MNFWNGSFFCPDWCRAVVVRCIHHRLRACFSQLPRVCFCRKHWNRSSFDCGPFVDSTDGGLVCILALVVPTGFFRNFAWNIRSLLELAMGAQMNSRIIDLSSDTYSTCISLHLGISRNNQCLCTGLGTSELPDAWMMAFAVCKDLAFAFRDSHWSKILTYIIVIASVCGTIGSVHRFRRTRWRQKCRKAGARRLPWRRHERRRRLFALFRMGCGALRCVVHCACWLALPLCNCHCRIVHRGKK